VVGIIGLLARFVIAIIGIVLVFTGIVLLFALVASLFAIPFSFFLPFDTWFFTWPQTIDMVLDTGWMTFLASLAVFLIVGIPVALLIFLGIRLAFNIESKNNQFAISMFILWLIGLAILSFLVLPVFFNG